MNLILKLLSFFYLILTYAEENIFENFSFKTDQKEVKFILLIDDIHFINIDNANFKINSEILFSREDPSQKRNEIQIIDISDN